MASWAAVFTAPEGTSDGWKLFVTSQPRPASVAPDVPIGMSRDATSTGTGAATAADELDFACET